MRVRKDELALINGLQDRICCRKVLNYYKEWRQHANVIKEVRSEGKSWNMGALKVNVTEFCYDVISCTYQSQSQVFRKQDI